MRQTEREEELKRKMTSYAKLNRFLSAFIDKVLIKFFNYQKKDYLIYNFNLIKILRECPYEVVKRNFIENVLNMETKNTNFMSWFYEGI